MKTSSRTTAKAQITISAEVNGVLRLRIDRCYLYNQRNRAGKRTEKMERLRPLLLAISIDDDSSWGIAWGVLFDAILEVQQAKPNEIEVRVVQIPAGEAGVLYRCLVRTVVHELDLKVATAIDERQMGLFS